MVNRTPELAAFEAGWSARAGAASTYADALAWFEAALAHVRAMGVPAAEPFESHEEARLVLASDIRVAGALRALEVIRADKGKMDVRK